MGKVPFRLVVRNLFKHKARATLTILSLAVAVFLICVLRSLVITLEAGVRAARSDRLIVQSAVSLFVDLPESYQAKIAAVEGVKETLKFDWFGGYYQDPKNFFAQFAVDPETLLEVYPEVQIVAGDAESFLRNRRACLVGIDLAEKYGFEVGQTIPIIGALYPRADGEPWTFDVAGIYRSTSTSVEQATLYFHYDYLDESLEAGAADGPDGVSIFVLQVAPDADRVAIMREIDELYANGPQRVQTTTEAEFQAQFVSMMGNVPFFVSMIGGGVFLAILLAVLNTMLMGAREQTKDVGVLKALGFTDGATFTTLLLQGVLLCVIGGAIGVGLAAGTSSGFRAALGTMFPGYRASGETLALGFALAVAVGVVAGIASAWRLARSNVVEQLRTEA